MNDINDLPYISLCMPVSGRREFKRLIISNLHRQDYPKEKIEFVIDCDGSNNENKNKLIKDDIELENFKTAIYPIKLSYNFYNGKKSIGEKRNRLVKIAKHKLIAFLDSDDLYLESYLKYSYKFMKENNYNLVGSNQMLFVFPPENYEDKWLLTGIRCKDKRMCHEATMMFTKKHFKAMGGFIKGSEGEGTAMVDGMNEKTIGLTDIQHCMVCICHPSNTIDKDRFKTADVIDGRLNEFDKIIIHKILYPNKN
tara:strand:+ start:881 stop:1639 length:759 start_codon:yes stop_codon:yes gene_type:complete